MCCRSCVLLNKQGLLLLSWLLGLVLRRDCGINNPPLAAAASDSVTVTVSKLLRESHQPLQTCPEYRSAVGIASNPSFPSRILSRTALRFSPKLRDKIWDGKPGFEAILEVVSCLDSHLGPSWTYYVTGKGWKATTTISFIV